MPKPKAAQERSVFIQANLVSGSHDELLASLQEDNRRMANHMVLSVSEACLEVWPVTIADYKAPGEGEEHPVKIALNPTRYPKLFALYCSLPAGVKGITMLNLLNRHQMMKDIEPERVNQALNRRLAGLHDCPVVDLEETLPAEPAASKNENVREIQEEADLVAGTAVEEITDPLISMPALSFD